MKFPWLDHHIETLKQLHADRYSASQIAEKLGGGVTRNAVIGKIHRLGLGGHGRQQPRAPRKPRACKARARKIWRSKFPQIEIARPARVDVFLPEPYGPRVSLTQLNANTCRWPYGDPASADFAYCGAAPKRAGSPYCPYHSQLAYTAPSERSRAKRVDQAKYHSHFGSRHQ